MNSNYLHSDISDKVIGAFYNVYNALGSGFLEKVYENAMVIELAELGLKVQQQCAVPVDYKKQQVGKYFADLLGDGKIIIELKSVEEVSPQHEAQLVNYLRGSNIEVGLILNFGPKPRIIHRVLTSKYKHHKQS